MRLVSLMGLFVMIGLAWMMSTSRRQIRPRVVIGGLLLQFVLAVFILRTTPGRDLFTWIGHVFVVLINSVDAGSEFVFGANFRDEFFAFKVLPTIIFFSALMSLLYHLGVMQRVIRLMAVAMQRTLGTSGAESIATAANVFVGQTEAPLVIRPFVAAMTRSELMAVMVGGFATIAGSVLAAYIDMGIDAAHLVAASVISAPAALLIAKVMEPETGLPQTLGRCELDLQSEGENALHAVTIGATEGAKLAINVAAMVIAFLAMIALANHLIGWLGHRFGQDGWSLEAAFGIAFAPLAWIMGVEPADCRPVGELLGIKIVANEFIAYDRLARWMQPDSGVRLSARSEMIATYALCGFANFGSIGVQLGALGSLAPERQGDLARLGLRAMIGGALAGFMTACVAGVLV